MKAVILNSGMGTRMGALTKEHPKCMTEIAERVTIISSQLKYLSELGVKDVVITTGYFNDVLVEYCKSLDLQLNIEYVFNPLYSKTNYIYSLYCAREILRDSDIILMHGDLVFERRVLEEILLFDQSCMAVSTTVELPPKDFKAVLFENKIKAVGIEFFDNAVAAQPLYKLLKKDWNIWLEQICNYCEKGETSCYAENAFNEISDKVDLIPFDVKNSLCNEVDTNEDLQKTVQKYEQLCSLLK